MSCAPSTLFPYTTLFGRRARYWPTAMVGQYRARRPNSDTVYLNPQFVARAECLEVAHYTAPERLAPVIGFLLLKAGGDGYKAAP